MPTPGRGISIYHIMTRPRFVEVHKEDVLDGPEVFYGLIPRGNSGGEKGTIVCGEGEMLVMWGYEGVRDLKNITR